MQSSMPFSVGVTIDTDRWWR